MSIVISRFFLFLLLVADWAGDPYCGHSPLSRPLASQDAFCLSVANRVNLERAITLSRDDIPIPRASISTLALFSIPWSKSKSEPNGLLVPTTDPPYALMSLQC
jgi:hypothetical protein